ncbi:sigma-70 family RNA polymerase sigma factor [Ramlibacter sp.]|uniref:sigma-70 family RNA polymerase sigma factor n=1 Tax=Ramlibacter sp. TaxID=1917967 RepID=UPI0018583ECF|nr:sigma-70 family RNA polymerase sigma factor [Ramlibacter sp.]MBA2672051.1 sigma-70 family RNA polymerase sigma factor [Ramlibacter sp.]
MPHDDSLVELIERIAVLSREQSSRRAAEDALRALYDITSGRLFGLALRVVGRREAAEDVLQEAFLQMWRSAGDYRASLSPPFAWMGLIVRSRALDYLRRRASERADVAVELDDALAETLPGSGADPMQQSETGELASAMHGCLRLLDARQREVVSLAYLRDLSHQELAQQLKLPLGTVKTWIRRGLEQLRACMARFA